jgi:hypothetical protein
VLDWGVIGKGMEKGWGEKRRRHLGLGRRQHRSQLQLQGQHQVQKIRSQKPRAFLLPFPLEKRMNQKQKPRAQRGGACANTAGKNSRTAANLPNTTAARKRVGAGNVSPAMPPSKASRISRHAFVNAHEKDLFLEQVHERTLGLITRQKDLIFL